MKYPDMTEKMYILLWVTVLAVSSCASDDLDVIREKKQVADGPVFGADLLDRIPLTRATGDWLPLCPENFDGNSEKGDFAEGKSRPVPIFIHQYKKKAEGGWEEHESIYTDWGTQTQEGMLTPYHKAQFKNGVLDYEFYQQYASPDKSPTEYDLYEELTWGTSKTENVFNAWTADFEVHHTSNDRTSRWVTMDTDANGKRSSKSGTVRFCHWYYRNNTAHELSDSYYLGVNGYDAYRNEPSLEHFVGLTQMVGTTAEAGTEGNLPLDYDGNGRYVPLRFKHLISCIRIRSVQIYYADGSNKLFASNSSQFGTDVKVDMTENGVKILFPYMRRYARFSTGNPQTGEGPHVLTLEEEAAEKSSITDYDDLLHRTFDDKTTATGDGFKGDEYAYFTQNPSVSYGPGHGVGLTAYWKSRMYVAPFDMSGKEGEFEVHVMHYDENEQKYTDDIETRYFGSLEGVVNNFDGGSTKLRAGDRLEIALVLRDGKVTGVTATVEGWEESGGSSSSGHSRPGVYTSKEFDNIRDKMSSNRNETSWLDPYIDNENGTPTLNIYEDIDIRDHGSVTHPWLPEGYVFDGNGHTLRVNKGSGSNDKFEPSSSWRNSKIKNLFVEMVNGQNSEEIVGVQYWDENGEVYEAETWDALFDLLDKKGIKY